MVNLSEKLKSYFSLCNIEVNKVYGYWLTRESDHDYDLDGNIQSRGKREYLNVIYTNDLTIVYLYNLNKRENNLYGLFTLNKVDHIKIELVKEWLKNCVNYFDKQLLTMIEDKEHYVKQLDECVLYASENEIDYLENRIKDRNILEKKYINEREWLLNLMRSLLNQNNWSLKQRILILRNEIQINILFRTDIEDLNGKLGLKLFEGSVGNYILKNPPPKPKMKVSTI